MALENQFFNEGDEQKRIAKKGLPEVFFNGSPSSRMRVAGVDSRRGDSWISL